MRMKPILMLAVSLILLGATALAQDTAPKAEFFGGYAYMRTAGNTNVNGWTAQGAFNLNNWFGIAADFTGMYQTASAQINRPSANLYSFTFGPQVYDRAGRITGFAHALFGGARVQQGFSLGKGTLKADDTGLAMLFGGGIDATINDLISVRLFQIDYEYLRAPAFTGPDAVRNNLRLGIGLVFKMK